jgi:hypothetical protein
VIGIRADVSIPKKFFGHFRYRWGFLILTSPAIPGPLVRFLTGIWLTAPYSLWLGQAVTFKQYLKWYTSPLVDKVDQAKEKKGRFTSAMSGFTEYYSDEDQTSYGDCEESRLAWLQAQARSIGLEWG